MEQTVDAAGPAAPADDSLGRDRRRGGGWIRWTLIALAVAAAAFLVWRLLFPPHKPPPPTPPTPVGVAKVTVGDMNVELRGIGTVTPVATITVNSIVSGILFKVGFKEGQIVRKGQLLDLVDPRPYQNALAQAQGSLVHDTGVWEQARSDLQRFLVLGRQNSIAQQQVADQQYAVRQDEGTVMVDRANVNSALLNLRYTRVYAPVTGRVGLRLVDEGNFIQSGAATALAVVTQLQPITVIFVLPETEIGAVTDQMKGGAKLEVTAWDPQDAKQIAAGTLLTIDNTVDTTTGTVKLRARFPNDDLALFPNEFVNARLRLKSLTGVTIVPSRAIQHGAPGTFVYLVRPNGTVGVQAIKTGVTQGDQVQVLSGLKAGDMVVTDGVDRLRDGAKVRVTPAGSTPAPSLNNGPGAPPGQQPQNARPAAGRGQSADHSG